MLPEAERASAHRSGFGRQQAGRVPGSDTGWPYAAPQQERCPCTTRAVISQSDGAGGRIDRIPLFQKACVVGISTANRLRRPNHPVLGVYHFAAVEAIRGSSIARSFPGYCLIFPYWDRMPKARGSGNVRLREGWPQGACLSLPRRLRILARTINCWGLRRLGR